MHLAAVIGKLAFGLVAAPVSKVEKPFYVYKEDGSYSDEMHAIYNSE